MHRTLINAAIRRVLLTLLVTVTLSSCIVFPANKGSSEIIHTGRPYGRTISDNVTDKDFVIEERRYSATDIKYLFSPEGPVRKSLGPTSTTYHYYISQDNHKTPLSHLAAYNENERWDQFFALGTKWYAMNYRIKARHIRLAVFSAKDSPLIKEFELNSGNAGVNMYLSKDRETLFWRTKDGGMYIYNPEKDKSPVLVSPGKYPELEQSAVKLAEIESTYDDTNFQTEKNEIIKADPYNATGIKQKIGSAYATKKENDIEQYSRDIHYIIRWAVVENKSTPTSILQRLTHDHSEYVANAAKQKLKERGESADSASDEDIY